jgi:hypothetical protein
MKGRKARPALASRVIKARRPGRCPLCRDLIRAGQQIGKTPIGWSHTSCIINKAKELVKA